MKQIWIAFAMHLSFVLVLHQPAGAQFVLSNGVFGNSVVSASGGGVSIEGTVGQGLIGAVSGSYLAESGFWYTLSSTSGPTSFLPADFNGDGEVGLDDFFLFVDAFGKKGTFIYDLNRDGEVGLDDFFLFVDAFGKRRSKPATKPAPPDEGSL